MQRLLIKNNFRNRANSFLVEWLLLILCFGYPIQAMLPVMLKMESTSINVGFRVIYLLISCFLIVHRRFNKIPFSMLIFLMFWVIYSYRIITDIILEEKSYLDKDAFYVFSFAFGSCLIPTVAIYLNTQFINTTRLVKYLFWIIFIANICIITNIVFFSDGILSLFVQRANANVEINGETVSIVNPITIGFFGEVLSLLSIFFLFFYNISENITNKINLWMGLLLGISNLLLGASRGPFLSFAILVFYIMAMYIRLNGVSKKQLIKAGAYICCILFAFMFCVNSYFDDIDFELFNRINNFLYSSQTGDKEERIYEWESAMKQFLQNPILGDSFVTDYDKSYAHNLFIDSLMATGLLGTFLLTVLIFNAIKTYINLDKRLKIKTFPIWLMFIGFFLLSMTSGGLFMVSSFWIFTALISSLLKYANN